MIPANAQQSLQLHTHSWTNRQSGAGQLAFAGNPRDLVRGFSYWGYFYFYFTNTSPFNAERTVMPG
jgi:hypothetical protein